MKDPELLEEFYEVLAAYNKMNDVQFTFTETHGDPDVVKNQLLMATLYGYLKKPTSANRYAKMCITTNLE
jgi:hypothetical protein